MSGKDLPPIIIKKKKASHGGHHGGAWKVAFADFITALMALFLVLWLVGQSQKVKQAVAGHFRNPGLLDGSKSGLLPGNEGVNDSIDPSEKKDPSPKSEEEVIVLENSASHLKKAFTQLKEFENIRNQIEINMTKEGLEIQMLEKARKVLFEVGSAQPVTDTRNVLTEIAKEIGKIQNKIVISGHTDRRPYSESKTYSNWELSTDRANSARRVLIENGMKPDQIARVVGYADTELKNPKDPFADANRRITMLVLFNKAGEPIAAPEEDEKKSQEEDKPVHKPFIPIPEIKHKTKNS